MKHIETNTVESSPYNRRHHGVLIDPYRIFSIYEIHSGAQQHAIKKLLRAGRSHKSLFQDIDETIQTLERWKEMINEDIHRLEDHPPLKP